MEGFDKTLNKQDEWYTPRYAVLPLLKYIKKGTTVWCPFDTDRSQFVQVLQEHGCRVIHSHIFEGVDFFTCQVPECDCIISNPPYSRKTDVLQRLYQIGKPFAMLIGCLGIFEGPRFRMMRDNGVQVLLMSKRVEYKAGFESDSESKAPPFSSWYICNKLLPAQIVFEEISKKNTNEQTTFKL